MKNKMLLLGMGALVALVFAALPAVASAKEWHLHNQSNGVPGAFTSAGGASSLTAEGKQPVKCTSNSGTGKYTTETTGTIELTFKGCTTEISEGSGAVNCTTSGQATGVVTTNTAVFHNVELEPNPAIEPLGVLITEPVDGSGKGIGFATFVCGGLQTIKVTGNVIGEITSKNCNSMKSKSMEINFTTKAGATNPTQKWEQVTTEGPVYDLTADFTGFPTNTAGVTSAMDAEGTVTFATDEVTPTCT
jgi:hypothetical protein